MVLEQACPTEVMAVTYIIMDYLADTLRKVETDKVNYNIVHFVQYTQSIICITSNQQGKY